MKTFLALGSLAFLVLAVYGVVYSWIVSGYIPPIDAMILSIAFSVIYRLINKNGHS